MRCVAVSPLVGGKAVTGPLDRMLLRMAGGSSVAHLTALYGDIVDVLVVDEADAGEAASVELASAPVLMPDLDAERRLAHRVLEVACG
jgi:LPPG:FO 2-phospho-L-lactate transferase